MYVDRGIALKFKYCYQIINRAYIDNVVIFQSFLEEDVWRLFQI